MFMIIDIIIVYVFKFSFYMIFFINMFKFFDCNNSFLVKI